MPQAKGGWCASGPIQLPSQHLQASLEAAGGLWLLGGKFPQWCAELSQCIPVSVNGSGQLAQIPAQHFNSLSRGWEDEA